MNPPSFSWPFLGNISVQNYLQKVLLSGKIYPAFLFAGPAQVGKGTLVRYFFQSLLCLQHHERMGLPLSELPCQKCSPCMLFSHHAYPDFFVFSSADSVKPFSVADARKIHESLSTTSFSEGPKGIVIDLMGKMEDGAANMLLKIFEEPPKNTFIFLITHHPYLLPATLRSRFQHINFSFVSSEVLYDVAIQRGMDRHEALLLARESLGRPGVFFARLEGSHSGDEDRFLDIWFRILEARDFHSQLSFSDEIFGKASDMFREKLERFLRVGNFLLRDIFFARYGRSHLVHFLRSQSRIERLAEQQRNVGFFQQRLVDCEKALHLYISPKNIFEHLLLSL